MYRQYFDNQQITKQKKIVKTKGKESYMGSLPFFLFYTQKKIVCLNQFAECIYFQILLVILNSLNALNSLYGKKNYIFYHIRYIRHLRFIIFYTQKNYIINIFCFFKNKCTQIGFIYEIITNLHHN